MAQLRIELKGDMAELRTELKGDMAQLRIELKGDMAELRTELKGDVLRVENQLTLRIADFQTNRIAGRSVRPPPTWSGSPPLW